MRTGGQDRSHGPGSPHDGGGPVGRAAGRRRAPGGDTIFVGLHAGGIVELDAATLDVVGEPLRFDRYVSNVDVSPGERLLAVELSNPDALMLVDNQTREVLATFDDVDAHWQLDFSPDGSLLAAGGTNGLVTLIDLVGQRVVGAPLRRVDGPVVRQSFSPDGSHLVTSSADGTVQLWNLAARERVARVTPGEPRHEVFAWFDDGGRTIVAADERGGIEPNASPTNARSTSSPATSSACSPTAEVAADPPTASDRCICSWED